MQLRWLLYSIAINTLLHVTTRATALQLAVGRSVQCIVHVHVNFFAYVWSQNGLPLSLPLCPSLPPSLCPSILSSSPSLSLALPCLALPLPVYMYMYMYIHVLACCMHRSIGVFIAILYSSQCNCIPTPHLLVIATTTSIL